MMNVVFCIKNLRNSCKRFCYNQSFWWDFFFHVMAENWQNQKDTLDFSSFLVYLNQNRVLLTSNLLLSIPLVVVSHLGNNFSYP